MTRQTQRLIHVGCRALAMDQEDRRALQLAVTGKESMSDMSEAELKAVLNRLKENGFKPELKGRKGHVSAPRADLRLVHVLWRKLGDAGELERPGRGGLNAFIRSRFEKNWGTVPADIDMLREHEKIDQVIQALKAWGERAGIDFDWEDHRR
ncbi:regulatory protein GemA [Sedimentitalea sp. JM2-8]|uniref:Regulatory protein GemA n=1 Tax=Sedimentitalea xiamensis TaxID=3050037 RepID=A0ABT7FC96_9RHOB|nr:regulatory protein GemA [Sedimentitalea xiamensis]MDK3072741.1 regulatory protein GemA [Sedimentitalea xiamensis]